MCLDDEMHTNFKFLEDSFLSGKATFSFIVKEDSLTAETGDIRTQVGLDEMDGGPLLSSGFLQGDGGHMRLQTNLSSWK